jgi:3-oxoacyl-[acyl-carrier protein] reductase
MDESLWDLTLEVNLGSVVRVTESLLTAGVIADNGRIVLVSSIAGIAGNTGQTNYAASKAGVIGLTQSLGAKLAGDGIAVNAVAPGFIETRLTDAIPFGIREVGRRLSNLNQGGLPVDVAEAITFLSSPGAGGLHGNVLRVCGGNLLGA